MEMTNTNRINTFCILTKKEKAKCFILVDEKSYYIFIPTHFDIKISLQIKIYIYII